MTELIVAIAATAVVVVIVFMLGRAIVLWYWKVDEQIVLLTEIRNILLEISGVAKPTIERRQLTERETRVQAETERTRRVRTDR
jgi:hypothetical protein